MKVEKRQQSVRPLTQLSVKEDNSEYTSRRSVWGFADDGSLKSGKNVLYSTLKLFFNYVSS